MDPGPLRFWCAVALSCAAGPGDAFARPTAEGSAYNLAESARVIASDPARKAGTKAGRLEEFPAEDLFLTSPLRPETDGTFIVPVSGDTCCIGLEWAERRVLTAVWIELVAPGEIDAKRVAVEYWSSQGRSDGWADIGQTPWQGGWERLPGEVRREGPRLSLSVDADRVPEFKSGAGTLRVRWLWPANGSPVRVRELGASSPSRWDRITFRIENEAADTEPWTIEAYNGRSEAVGPGETGVLYSVPGPSKADRTLLRFRSPRAMFSVAVEDVFASDGVYVKDYGVYVTRAEGGPTLAEYRRRHADDRTLLQRVREMPDQTFGQAMAALWRPIQNNGPTMLSLAADNRKFIVQRTGEILFKTDQEILRVTPRFGPARTRLDRLDWGGIGLDRGVVPPGGKGQALQIDDVTYKKGLGLHANAQFSVELGGEYAEFRADVGVQWQGGGDCGRVSFEVLADGRKLFESGPMGQGDAARPVKIALAGERTLTLLATTGPDIACAVANWAEARLVRRDGRVEYLSDLHAAAMRLQDSLSRRLHGDWLPSPVNSVEHGGIRYTQRSLVAPLLDDAPIFVAEFTIENTADASRAAVLSLMSSEPGGKPLELVRDGQEIGLLRGADLRGWVELHDVGGLGVEHDSHVKLSGSLPAGGTARCRLVILGSPMPRESFPAARLTADHDKRFEAYWRGRLGGAMQVETPEPLLNDFIRSTQVRCWIAARTEESAGRPEGSQADSKEARPVAPWIAADTYGPLDTEAQAVILGMDLFGHHEFARRSHQFFVGSYNADGMLAKGYTLMGTGQHLWTLAEHVRLTRDNAWLERMAPQLLRPCAWIDRQRAKTRTAGGAAGIDEHPESGLVPPGVLADWNRYAYYLYANAHFQAGLAGLADVLGRVNHPAAGGLKQAAAAYRDDILRACRWNQERMPVVPLRDGTWVPPTPSSLHCYGLTRDFFGGVSATGHDVEVGGNHLVPLGLIDPMGRQADWIADYYEDRWFLIDGIFGGYPASENEKDWFNRGGFAKLQPHYARTSDLHALRDDVKPFIRTYFNTFPVLLNRENLTYWEHLNNGGAWDKTHESGWFLQMTRMMLVTERGGELWLAPFVTGRWLEPGRRVSVRNAPTHFGPVSYALEGAADRIRATIEPPAGPGLERIVLRLRHPEARPFRGVTVDGKAHTDFDPKRETIALRPGKQTIRIEAHY